ncbi:transmembrane protein 71 isoform X2 [Xenopus laevis]|uniref:Transmembrane protein 71 isoform X2 n=1 Tax=Xenopus laevis TaxID=8355 RepID=A0A8J1L1Z1_XENLA|nr:transmembrane protein 71 isoform X2 [Xenopus laevis]
MNPVPNVTSTPVADREHSFFNECTLLPTKLFGNCSARDSFDLGNTSTSLDGSFSSGFFSPCRHSPRLLTNGYYVLDEDSFAYDDEGNISLEPTKSIVSYKENIARIFRRKRRHMSQRSLNSMDDINQVGSFLLGELWDVDIDLSEDKSTQSSDRCAFIYNEKNWTPTTLCSEPSQYSPGKQAGLMLLQPSGHECPTPANGWSEGKRWMNQVLFFSIIIIILILWARFGLYEVISALLTAFLLIRLFSLLLQPPQSFLGARTFNKKVT